MNVSMLDTSGDTISEQALIISLNDQIRRLDARIAILMNDKRVLEQARACILSSKSTNGAH
jgi:hypothetical protein